MNIKKGLFRLWLISLPIISLWSYFYEVKQATSNMMLWYGYHQTAKIELTKPICNEIVQRVPQEFPHLDSPNPCINLAMFWKELKEINPVGTINEKDIDALFKKNWSNYQSEHGLIAAASSLILYHSILFIFAMIFFVGRWIIAGFKK